MNRKQQVALVSLIASLSLAAIKLSLGIAIGSLALITDALHSGTDFLATLVTYFAVRVSDSPPDEDHPYGHGKYENIAALGEATLLLLLAGGVTVEAWRNLQEGAAPPAVAWYVYAVMIGEIAVNSWRAIVLQRTARETGSAALAADALHFGSDVASSIAVIAGFVATELGYWWGDPVAALGVAVLIAVLALRMIKGTVDELTDKVPAGLIKGLHRAVTDLPGVVEVRHLRLRTVGHRSFVDVATELPRTLSNEQIMAVKAEIVRTILADVPGAEITASCNPVAVTDETVRERVLIAAARHGLPIHHVTIQRLAERLSISLDLEVDGSMPLGEAHQVASDLEDTIRGELGSDVEVETHLEPLFPDLLPGAALNGPMADEIASALIQAAPAFGITDVHNLRIRALGDGLFVAFHCRFDPATSAGEVHHKVDMLERTARDRFPQIKRIVSHPEPTRSVV